MLSGFFFVFQYLNGPVFFMSSVQQAHASVFVRLFVAFMISDRVSSRVRAERSPRPN